MKPIITSQKLLYGFLDKKARVDSYKVELAYKVGRAINKISYSPIMLKILEINSDKQDLSNS